MAGTVRIDGDVDLADALDLEAAIAADAHHQLLLGSTESLDVRRSIAAGNLARNQQTLDLTRARGPASRPARRRVAGGAARPPRAKPPSSAPAGWPGSRRPAARSPPNRSAQWCANPDTQVTVQPVLDLAEHLHVGSYEASARLKLQTQLRDLICAFPFCFRPAEHCDCEHRVPADPANPDRDDGGPTCTCNLAPCCRRHHRAKTTGGWTYITVEPGVYLWRSPLGYQFLNDHTGTLDVTPDPERRRLARTSPPTSAPQPPPTPNPDHPAPHPAQRHSSGEFGALSAAWSGGARQRQIRAPQPGGSKVISLVRKSSRPLLGATTTRKSPSVFGPGSPSGLRAPGSSSQATIVVRTA